MDVQKAISDHVNWKLKLTRYISKPDKSLKAEHVGSPDGCDLGKWLNANKVRFATDPDFKALVNDHAHFHKEAAEIIRKADSGASTSSDVALGGTSPYAKVSNAIVSSLMRMKSKLAA